MTNIQSHLNNRKVQLLFLLLITLCCFFSHLGLQFADYMETRNFVTAREIIKNDSWLLPTMNGELRIEKPPLPTWITAFFMFFFGDNNLFYLRLPAALSGILLIYYTFRFVEELTKEKLLPFMAGATVATSFYLMFQSRVGTWDIYCHSFMMGAIFHLYQAFEKSENYKKRFVLAGIFLGLSAFSKGPVSFYALLLPFLISYFYQKGITPLKGKVPYACLAILISVLISQWWSFYILLAHPEETAAVLAKESEAWINHNTRPFYHYWWFVAQSGIWVIGAIMALIIPFARKRISNFSNYDLIWGWVIIGVALLSILPEKKERYLVPILIPLGILTAHYFYSLFRNRDTIQLNRKEKLFISFNNGIMILIVSLTPLALLVGKYNFNLHISLTEIILATAISIVFVPNFISAIRKKDIFKSWLAMVLLFCSIAIALFPIFIHIMTKSEYKPMTSLRENTQYQNLPVYYHGDFLRLELVWEGGKKISYFHPDLLKSHNPFVLISNKETQRVVSEFSFKKHEIQKIDDFNSSWNGRNKKTLINNVSIVTPQID